MDRLRTATATLHDKAEKHTFQQELLRGRLPIEAYLDFTLQMRHLHVGLETRLRDWSGREPFCRVVREHHYRAALFDRDLRFFGCDPTWLGPAPATVHVLTALAAAVWREPASALGFLYVLEGSTNGSKFIARSVRQAYGLVGEDGLRWLVPHGEHQSRRWAEFKSDMNAVAWEEPQVDAAIRAAELAFGGVVSICDALMPVAA